MSTSSPAGRYAEGEDGPGSGGIRADEISYLNQLATFRLMRVHAHPSEANRSSPPKSRSDGAPGEREKPQSANHGTFEGQLPRDAVDPGYGQPFWPVPFAATDSLQFEQTAEYTAAGALTDMSATAPGVLPDFSGASNLVGTVDDEYYQRMAGYISDYITWDGNLNMFDASDSFEPR